MWWAAVSKVKWLDGASRHEAEPGRRAWRSRVGVRSAQERENFQRFVVEPENTATTVSKAGQSGSRHASSLMVMMASSSRERISRVDCRIAASWAGVEREALAEAVAPGRGT